MPINRIAHDIERPYTVISNSLLRDMRLSYRARGIISYALSNANGWRITLKELWEGGKEGRDAVYAAIKELKNYGYIRIKPIYNKKMRIVRWEWWWYEKPIPENQVMAGIPTHKHKKERIISHNTGFQ